MNTKLRTRTLGLAALALTASMSLTACGSGNGTSASDGATSTSDSPSPSESPSPSASDSPVADGPFGPACAQVPTSGQGSVQGMADDPVATAASNNPLLTTLVKAVTQAGLVDTLNSADGITVFAPTNEAFAKIPMKDLNALLANKKALTQVLTHHVVGGRLGPDQVAGTLDTLNKDTITVEGSGENFTAEGANVVCGNVQTANATVYLIDSVMMPKM